MYTSKTETALARPRLGGGIMSDGGPGLKLRTGLPGRHSPVGPAKHDTCYKKKVVLKIIFV